MQLEQLTLRNFRCFREVQLELDPRINWIVGQNASGKTSLLEALFFLGHARSFRSSRPDRLIRTGADGFEVVARLRDNGRQQVLGLGRKPGLTQMRLAGRPLKSMAEAAKALPVVVLDSGMNQLVGGGPGERRRWLDWGVFHVEHDFLRVWREYQQALRQRNSALKISPSGRGVAPWTLAVSNAGSVLSDLRRKHLERLNPIVREYVSQALPDIELHLDYRQGWAQGETLEAALHRHLERDLETGTTRVGPHRADLQLQIEHLPAEERLSRGQQKMLAGALWLAQVQLFIRVAHRRPLLLVDDLAAELDGINLQRFLELLKVQDAQHVLTAISEVDIGGTGLEEARMFHVEHLRLQGG